MGSGSLLLNAKKYATEPGYIKYYGQELNTSTYNLARMNMFLHGITPENQVLRNGDTLDGDWPTGEETDFISRKAPLIHFYSYSVFFFFPDIPAITIINQKNGCLQFINVKLSASNASTAARCARSQRITFLPIQYTKKVVGWIHTMHLFPFTDSFFYVIFCDFYYNFKIVFTPREIITIF